MSMRRAVRLVMVVGWAVVGCATTDAGTPNETSSAVVTVGAALTPTAPTPTAPTPESSSSPTRAPEPLPSPAPSSTATEVDRDASICDRTGVDSSTTVANPELDEASGLAVSRAHPGVVWAHNDGGEAGVFAIGVDGADLGFHPIDGLDAVDIEDMAIASGADGDVLHLADIGDNGLERRSVRLYRFAEPDPAVAGPIMAVEVLEFVYPDGPHNAETLLIDELDNRAVIVTKEQSESPDGDPDRFGRTEPALVFAGDLSTAGAEPRELVPVGTIDTLALEALEARNTTPHPASLLGFGGVVTGGDVSADAALIALRTYEAVWVWSRGPDQSVVDALASAPCQVASVSELQGEAVAFDSEGLLTLGEGVSEPLNRLAR